MKRATVTISDDLERSLDAYIEQQEVSPALTTVVQAAAATLDRFPDQLVTLTDAVTAVLSRRLRMAVWSFDRHFAILGTKQWCPAR